MQAALPVLRDKIDRLSEKLDAKIEALEAKMDARFGASEASTHAKIGAVTCLRNEIKETHARIDGAVTSLSVIASAISIARTLDWI